ncbi:MAG: hypothetical protein WBA57_18435 [Elainellaceae cyanobacterium]
MPLTSHSQRSHGSFWSCNIDGLRHLGQTIFSRWLPINGSDRPTTAPNSDRPLTTTQKRSPSSPPQTAIAPLNHTRQRSPSQLYQTAIALCLQITTPKVIAPLTPEKSDRPHIPTKAIALSPKIQNGVIAPTSTQSDRPHHFTKERSHS